MLEQNVVNSSQEPSFKYGKVSIQPSPMLIDSIRYSGHNYKTAIKDIVDNSLDAGASEIFILIGKEDKKSRIVIADNGSGMSPATLQKAFSLGCSIKNGGTDQKLGRFGMGLKTASGCLGNELVVLTKSEGKSLIRGEHFFKKIEKEGWFANISVANDDDNEYFNNIFKSSKKGTIIIIQDLRISDNIYQLKEPMLKEIGRTYRYFLAPKLKKDQSPAPIGKIKMYFGSSVSNCKPVYGLDPLERQHKDTKIVLEEDVKLDNGRSFKVSISILNRTSLDCDLNFKPTLINQGVYIVRENREIQAHTAKHRLFGGKVKDPHMNYIRMEIRYSNMDDVFELNNTKTSIETIDQPIADKIETLTSSYISQWAKDCKKASSVDSTKGLDKILLKAQEEVEGKKNILELPSAAKGKKRPGTTDKKGTVKGTGEGSHHSNKEPKEPKDYSNKPKDYEFKERDMSEAGPIFEYGGLDNGVIEITWNVAHPYFCKFIAGNIDKDSNDSLLLSLQYMAFAMTSSFMIFCQRANMEYEDAQVLTENMMGTISNNLRALSR
ncbi:MAG: ATP-binding protein [Candidatus Asgardarchaeia archaeon]